MENKNKRAFLEAFLFTLGIFVLGILFGMSMENKNLNEMNDAFLNSQVTMFDTYLITTLVNNETSCDLLGQEFVKIANKIYLEAELMDEYEKSSQVSENIKIVHKKYDVLRTMLWSTIKQYSDKCSNYDTVVYLYEYNSEDLTQQANQNVWSKILGQVKEKVGDQIILIPIAVDQNLSSLDTILSNYDIEKYPVVLVNDDKILYDTVTVSDFLTYLK
jgi:hypothetical protein